MLKEIIDHIPLFSQSKKNPTGARSKSKLNYKMSKSCDLNVANFNKNTESKKSPRHLKLFEAVEENYESLSFQIHQGTQ